MTTEKQSPQQRAELRTCASCEWIYRGHRDCPKCGFGSYGARWVYGPRAYQHERTQDPWLLNKLASYERELRSEIDGEQTVSVVSVRSRSATR